MDARPALITELDCPIYFVIAAERGEETTFPRERLARTVESFAPLLADRLAQCLGFGPANLLELMYQDAQKQQSRPLLIEQVNAALGGDLCP